MYLFGGAYLVPLGNYLLLFIYDRLCCVFFFLFFCFLFFFFPVARTNSVNVVDQKQSVLDATAIGNFFLHKHLLLFIYAVYVVFSSFRFLFFFFSPLREQTQRTLWTKNRVSLMLLLLVILFFTNISWSGLLLH